MVTNSNLKEIPYDSILNFIDENFSPYTHLIYQSEF